MKTFVAVSLWAALASGAHAAPAFTIDDLSPGEGIASECYVVLWRSSAKTQNGVRPAVLESDGERAYVKVDGEVYPLRPVGQYTYESAALRSQDQLPAVKVAAQLKTIRTDITDEGVEVRDLKGEMQVTYGGRHQTIKVLGEYACVASAPQ
ncbi:hypothetical protein [Asticcacaulis biprosthecium]|nr:hypothetical protein [Asticcacaulis biprosthecium]